MHKVCEFGFNGNNIITLLVEPLVFIYAWQQVPNLIYSNLNQSSQHSSIISTYIVYLKLVQKQSQCWKQLIWNASVQNVHS